MENITKQPVPELGSSDFTPLGLAEVESFPQRIIEELAEQWSKSTSESDRARARAVVGKLPKSAGHSLSKATLKIVIRCCADEAALAWIGEACQEVKDTVKKSYSRWEEAFPMGMANFMPEAALAMRRSKPGLAKFLTQGSHGLDGALAISYTDGSKSSVDLSGESLRAGAFDVFRAGFERCPAGIKRSMWSISAGHWAGAALRSSAKVEAMEKAWDVYRPLFEGRAGEAVGREVFEDLLADPDLLVALAYSPSRRIRSEFEAAGGAAVRDRFLSGLGQDKRERWWIWLGRMCKSADQSLIEQALRAFDLPARAAEREPMKRLPFMMELSKEGGKTFLRALHGACQGVVDAGSGEPLFRRMALQTEWVWESKDGRRRKKGDALAHCVALGDQAAAASLLELDPSLPTAYAKDLVKYCSLRNNDIQGQATAAWESILLGKITSAPAVGASLVAQGESEAKAAQAPARSRGRL